MVIDKSELEDFKTILRKHGYPEEDFGLTWKRDASPARPSPETGSVTVRNKRTGVERTYGDGYLAKWVVEFEQDLKAGCLS